MLLITQQFLLKIAKDNECIIDAYWCTYSISGIKFVFRYNWNKGLGVALEFEKKHVVNGETVNVVEVISNEKRLPLPCVNLKFQVDRELEFPGTDTNSSVSDLTYRNDVFSFLANQRITRRIPVKCNHRGVFKISGVQLTFAGPFMNEINVLKVDSTCEITVYPKTVDSKRFSFIRSRISGEAERKKYMLEDPFVFRGIRDYTSNDSLKNVNWKATARTGNLCVNEYNESVSRNVCILLNLEDDGMLTYDSVNEEAISLAASVAEEFIRQGINVSLISNACDVDTKEAVGIREGAGVGHLGSINTVLARMDLKLEKEEFAELINRTFIENVSVQSSDNSVYVVISASRRKKLQQTMQKFEKKYGQVIWIVPYMTGGEYSLDYCGIRPEGWEVK